MAEERRIIEDNSKLLHESGFILTHTALNTSYSADYRLSLQKHCTIKLMNILCTLIKTFLHIQYLAQWTYTSSLFKQPYHYFIKDLYSRRLRGYLALLQYAGTAVKMLCISIRFHCTLSSNTIFHQKVSTIIE